MDGQSDNRPRTWCEPVAGGLAPPAELETGEIPDSLVADFSSLTTPYCWVIIEDAVAGYDRGGAFVGRQGRARPGRRRATSPRPSNAGRFFRLVDGKGRWLAIRAAI